MRDLRGLVIEATGSVKRVEEGSLPWTVAHADPEVEVVCESFLRQVYSHRSESTVRSYAYDLLRWFRFLAAIEVSWVDVTPADVADFFVWMKKSTKQNGNQNPKNRDPRITRNAVTGKAYVTDEYSRSTMNHNETVLHAFYEHHRHGGRLLRNPVQRTNEASNGERLDSHRNPLQSRRQRSRGGSRQRTPKRLPRSMPDEQYDEFFNALGHDRDRALVAMYVSSGARPSEVLGLDLGDIDLVRGTITVRRKGGGVQEIPISADAVTWYRLYQGATPGLEQSAPAWATLRGVARPLGYDALRAMFRRANQKNGTNWTPHDLRHTAATRMINGGASVRVVQEVLGHATLETLHVYTVPRLDEMVAAVRGRAHQDDTQARPTLPALPYSTDDMDILFGGGDQ